MFRNRYERSDDMQFMADMAGDMRGAFRARRGMIEPTILEVLLERPMHGYEIMDKIEEQSHGMWRPSAGSIYPTLQMLEEKDLLAVKNENGKKVYSLTNAGREEADKAKEQRSHLREFFADKHNRAHSPMNHDYQRHFHKEMGMVVKMMRDIFRKGSEDQRVAMDDAVVHFKERLEQISRGES